MAKRAGKDLKNEVKKVAKTDFFTAKTSKSIETNKKKIDLSTFDFIPARSAKDGLKILAWNVNGLRAVLKKKEDIELEAYLIKEDPDILCLSETKMDQSIVSTVKSNFSQFKYQYWQCASKKGYSGTAILSKTKPLSVQVDIITAENGKKATRNDEGRFIALEYSKFWLVHTYVPNAGMKLDRLDYRTENWDVALLDKLKEFEKQKPVVWCGDLNVAHNDIDIHDPIKNKNKSPGFTDAERESFSKILDSGFVDTFRHLYPETQQFTYWSYRFQARIKNKGWRLDYFVVSSSFLSNVTDSFVRKEISGSDHVPVGLQISSQEA